ncbi:2-polyprenyl-6-methoxyphenol hydroxylase-like FAD-dependent oxidoreductase [Actinocorallia herbida]|uniref:2-polyprenyl-6-methoxyphenol hydroxylase-like FAD-dependent oxidoreductase n=1 Tax=Actinocorallia herbida TaxID=58109 RepID=A0A3N1CZH2_9ACTN|nr:FAD-dependent oxidoreductase [Actinocorallia herbida]ROO86693.1 2-polyprenyl-6-methoxyphenol hydroxylase-like FAD-dependent oxidoreductase [Actinocorallia herbida]
MSATPARLVVIGAGLAGLATALSASRAGHDVVVVERDAMPALRDGDEAFTHWARPSVPQWRLVHNLSARVRELLLAEAPDVLDLLRADGIEEVNPIEALLPPELRRPEDAALTGLVCRRPAFELALRRALEHDGKVRLLVGKVHALGLTPGATPVVNGVLLADGTRLDADLVVDAAGRRTPVPQWLREAGADLRTDSEPCELIYYSRYFRAAPDRRPDYLGMPRGDLGHLHYWTFVGDHRTYGAVFGVPTWDHELRELRHGASWDALAAEIPALAAWTGRFDGTPLHEPQVMANNHNTRHHYVVGDRPLVRGLVAVGDALSTTNPMRAWGIAMALTHAFAVAPALASDDGVELAHHRAVEAQNRLIHEISAVTDRLRRYRWRGLPVPPADAAAAEEESLLSHGVLPFLGEQPEFLRAVLRSMALIDPPDALFHDPAVVERAREARARGVAAASPGPDRARTLELVATALRETA